MFVRQAAKLLYEARDQWRTDRPGSTHPSVLYPDSLSLSLGFGIVWIFLLTPVPILLNPSDSLSVLDTSSYHGNFCKKRFYKTKTIYYLYNSYFVHHVYHQ